MSLIANKPAAETFSRYLSSVRDAVSQVKDHAGNPVAIPDYDTMVQAAVQLDCRPHAADIALVIQRTLGRAQSIDMEAPGPGYPLRFPEDHHLHPAMGAEWYYLACNLQTKSPTGESRRFGVLFWMQKNRMVGRAAQQEAGWTDDECHIFASKATVVMETPGGPGRIIRRSRNVQWPLKGGAAAYSQPGEDFRMFCGTDSMIGGASVLPLRAQVDDGEELSFDLTVDCLDGLSHETAFYLRGDHGTGLTLAPTPGIEYSWPQVVVTGNVTVDGVTYEVESGSGWLDHQLLMASLEGAGVPFVDDPKPFVGWCWLFLNFANHTAFTGIGMNLFGLSLDLQYPEGTFLEIDNGRWKTTTLTGGSLRVDQFASLATIATQPRPAHASVLIPNRWTIAGMQNSAPFSGALTPWAEDGTFNPEDWSVLSEMPVDFTSVTGAFPGGTGYVESIGYENVISYQKRAVAFLETGILPGEGGEPSPPLTGHNRNTEKLSGEDTGTMPATKKKVERLDDNDEKEEVPGEKLAGAISHELGVFAKAASLYFDKLHELHTASGAKKGEKALTDLMANAQKANKAAMKHVIENSDVHKEVTKQAKNVVPGSSVDDLHKWVNEEDD